MLTPLKLAVLNVHVPWAQYRVAKDEHAQIKAQRHDLKARVQDARLVDQPLYDLQAQLADDIERIKRRRKACIDNHIAASAELASSTTKLGKHVRGSVRHRQLTAYRRERARSRRSIWASSARKKTSASRASTLCGSRS